ncbi:MAG: histidine kinase N-terminal 7TM domain-containing protein [Pelolinea sp.]|nr:histidine kinase N-terminal 7TM domain-containing protein [Pelolinea sp.]
MQNQFPGFTIAYAVSVVLCFLSAGMAWKRRNNPGSIPFALLMLALAAWSFATIFEAGALTVPLKIFWSKWQYLGITAIAPLWILFSAEYTGKKKILSKKIRRYLWVIPLTTLFLVFTNEYHGLVWAEVTILPDTVNTGYYERGAAFYIHTAFSYACLLFGTIWLIKDSLSSEKNRQFQSVIFIFGVIVSWMANALYVLRLLPAIEFDIIPLSISFVALLMAWNISRYQLFNLVPVARDALLNSLNEGVIVIDPNDIILEVNPSALEIAGYQGPQPVGRFIWEVFSNYRDVIEQFRDVNEIETELEIPGDPVRFIDLQISSIEQKKEEMSGQMIILRDITKRKEAEKIRKGQQDFAEAIADTAAVINSSLDLNEVLDKILENVAKVVPHDGATIVLVDDLGFGKFAGVKSSKKYGSMDTLLSLDFNVMEMNNFKKMSASRKAMIIADTLEDDNWVHNIEESEWIRSYLGAPIFHQDKLLGFINLDAGTPNFFKPEHLERLEIFANYTATALTNANLYSEATFHAEEMEILYEISLAIAAGVGLEQTTQAVFRQLKKVIPIDLFYLALFESTEKVLSYFMYQGNGERIDIKPFHLFQKQSLTRFVMEKQQTVYIPDFDSKDSILKEDEVIKVAGFENRTVLGIPLILRGEVMGVLSMQAAKPNVYDHDQIRLLETIAQQTSIAMDNAKLFEKMQAMAITDSLTELYNRRYFYMVLENEIERAKRYPSSLSLIMLDIDHFKRVNDKHGHLAGDEVLLSFSNECRKLLRQSDVMFRYGGEEFMILLPESNKEETMNVAERIRSAIEETEFGTKKGMVKITTSLGVSEFSEPSEFIESVDKAMYAAKEAGRNCVKYFSEV